MVEDADLDGTGQGEPPGASGRPGAGAAGRGGCLRYWWAATIVAAAAAVALGLWDEGRTSRFQSRVLARYAARLTYRFAPGPTDSVSYPAGGPFDLRRGYAFIPQIAETLAARDLVVTGQARMSPELLALTRRGFYAVYPTDTRAGLRVLDREERPLYAYARSQARFDQVVGG